MAIVMNGHSATNGHSSTQPVSGDIRDLIPKLGLREYWYPALRDREVGTKKPVFLRMLGEDLVAFRGKSGQVVIFPNACPHRGAMLSEGDCLFNGFLTCFYHGYTYDDHGECVAVLGEGPESPMVGKVRAQVYPTVTLKGVVFVWMGHGEPVAPERGIPEDFFEPDTLVLNWVNTWQTNWRPALENAYDSHYRMVHRDSARVLMRPFPPAANPLRRRAAPKLVGEHRLTSPQDDAMPAAVRVGNGSTRKDPREYYPGVDAKWPAHNYRRFWTWLFDWPEKRKLRRPYILSPEWGAGQHLPGMVRQNYWTYVFTRWVVPVEENSCKLFYFHSAKRTTWPSRLWERVHFALIGNWLMNKNFSEQDSKGSVRAYHNTREHLSPSDIQTIVWRKVLLNARGLEQERDLSGLNGAEDELEREHAQAPDSRG